jgi:hypothetical protein
VPGNVCVISDHANRLKGQHSLPELRERARRGARKHQWAYERLAAYVERESLLAEVRRKAADGSPAADEWAKIAAFLERAFRKRD